MSVELLAPAGNLEKAKIAILYGADAVYIGGQSFSLRSRASNFSLEQIKELTEFAHTHHAKVHVTVNIIPHPEDLVGLKEYLQQLDALGVDAIIAASAAVIHQAKSINPHFEIHLSTQHSTLNAAAVRFWQRIGVDRVVLGREANLENIEQICADSQVPIEVFIHGGMCISYSGRCVLSNHMTNRDANRGGCAQSCRWKYDLQDQGECIGSSTVSFSMSSRDLQAVPYLERIIQSGAASLKVEGRMKSAYYLATVVSAYRRLIDHIESGHTADPEFLQEIEHEIAKAENRPAAGGFYGELPKADRQLYREHAELVTQEFIGFVMGMETEGWLKVQVRNRFFDGETAEIFGPDLKPSLVRIEAIRDEEGQPLSACTHPMDIVYLKWNGPWQENAMIRRAGNTFQKDAVPVY